MSDKVIQTPVKVRFATQWGENDLSNGQVFTEPSCTIPDQSMTIPEIIAKFTRTGMVPGTISLRDKGGNIAVDPEFDPLDDYDSVMAAAEAAKAALDKKPDPDPATDSPAPAPAGA